MEYDMTGSGFNANFGVLYKPLEGLSIGVSYRLETRIKLESGGARLYGSGSPSGTWLEASYCRISMPMPANLLAGAAYEIIPGLTFEGDIQYVQWSTFKQLKIEIPAGLIDQESVIYDKNLVDGYIGRLGLEYQFNDDLALRGGLVYDITPQPASTMEPMFPDADKIDATVGIGYRLDQLISVDVAYMLMYYYDRTSYSFPQGTYESIGHLIAVDVSFSF